MRLRSALGLLTISLAGCGHPSESVPAPRSDAGTGSPDARSGPDGTPDDPSEPLVTEPDPALELGEGPSSCDDAICGADRVELPRGEATFRRSPTTVIPEPPRIERILRHSELANPACLADCPSNAEEDAARSRDCRGRPVQPAVPAHRTTTDGRVALVGGGPAVVAASRLDGLNERPLVRRDDALYRNVFSAEVPVDVSAAQVPPGSIRRDPPTRFFCGEKQAPRRCGEDDCYDLTLVEDWHAQGEDCPNGWNSCARFASVPVTIRVANPKTQQAVVTEARATGDWRAGPAYPANTAEPVATADGRLVVFRLFRGHFPEVPLGRGTAMRFAFTKNDGTIHEGRYSLAYAYSETPCDVRAWFSQTPEGAYRNLRPLAAAPYDARLSRYGFAAYPLRDAYGRVFEEGDLIRGSYPWIDRHGNNVFFSTILPVGIDDDTHTTRYPMSIEHPKLGRPTSRSPRGFAVAGSWTHGKIVMLDGLLNNEDYGIDAGDTRRLELYRTASGVPISVRIDGNSNTRAFATNGAHGNSQHIESLENTHAMHLGMHPVTPRDVVWTMARGDALQEVVFDDMIDPHVLLFAPMNAAWTNPRTLRESELVTGARRGHYQDGFSRDGGDYLHDPSAIALQNAATSPRYPIARFGSIDGDARVEPVAQGGVEGRGLWLEADTTAVFSFPERDAAPARSFYVGAFFDARAALDGGRRLFVVEGTERAVVAAHPGGISVRRSLPDGREEIASFPVDLEHPWRESGWHHVGVLFGHDAQVTVLVDGNPIGEQPFATAVSLGAGARVLLGGDGDDLAGARGWFDELRVVIAGAHSQLEHVESVELLCNYARGTMAALDARSRHFVTAAQHPAVRARAETLGLRIDAEDRLHCVTDYTHDLAVAIPLPIGEQSLRRQILEERAGNARLHAGAPRPDTTTNGFCLSCHAEAEGDPHRPEGLTLDALTAGAVPVEDDPRTQPAQPYSRWGEPATVEGIVPQGWFTSIHGVAVPVVRRTLPGSYPILDWVLRE